MLSSDEAALISLKSVDFSRPPIINYCKPEFRNCAQEKSVCFAKPLDYINTAAKDGQHLKVVCRCQTQDRDVDGNCLSKFFQIKYYKLIVAFLYLNDI